MPGSDPIPPGDAFQRIFDNIAAVMLGQADAVRKLLAAFAAGGHALIEDYPGTGKTTLAKALSRSIDSGFKRVQFTPDLLPSDILGVSVFNPRDQAFHFHGGPIFTNILLADEINRASPRTQSALLEAMAENQVSIDGKVRRLEDLFFVIATQNPVESRGVYPLPESQMDRFALRLGMGYVSQDQEVGILSGQQRRHPLDDIAPCVTMDDVLRLKTAVKEVRLGDELRQYIVSIVRATRTAEGVKLGAGPRASIALMKTAQALALFDKYDFVAPEHIQDLAGPVIAHRLVLDPQAKFSGADAEGIVEEIIRSLPVPA